MRRLFFALVAILFSTISFAQEAHMKFKGIPICGDVNSMERQLKALGLRDVGHYDQDLAGHIDFAGYADCTCLVHSTSQSHTVYMITIIFPSSESWTTLRSQYDTVQKSLLAKYNGKYVSSQEFVSPFKEGDGYEMLALHNHKCDYSTDITMDEGNLLLRIGSIKYGSGYVSISYIDHAGYELKRTEETNQVLSDL